MIPTGEFGVIVENGVLRPEQPLAFPEKTRLVISVHRVEPTPQEQEWGRQEMHRIREQGLVSLNGWRPTRDELHERD